MKYHWNKMLKGGFLSLILGTCALVHASSGYMGKSILDYVENPDTVSDWSPVIRQAIQDVGEGGAIWFPGARTYLLGSPIILEHGQVFHVDGTAVLSGAEMSGEEHACLFVIRGNGNYLFEGIGGRARLETQNAHGSVFNLQEIPEGVVPNIQFRRLHVVGFRGINGMAPDGVSYDPETGFVGEYVVEDCHIEATDMGIVHRRGKLGSLRVENSLFTGEPRWGINISSPITGGAMVRGNRLLNIGIRAISLGGGAAGMIDDGAVEHLPVVTVHDNQIIGGGHRAGEESSYIHGILVYGQSISIQGNIVRDFNRGEPVPGERVGHHFKMKDGSWHRGPWVARDGTSRRRLAGAAIYAKARDGIIANNVCTNSGWRAVIEVKTGGREPYFLIANNVVDGRSLSIEDSFGFEPNVAKAMWVNNLVYNMPNMAFKVTNGMQSTYINNVIYDSKIGFVVHDNAHANPELIANNHFINVETPVYGLNDRRFTAYVSAPMPIIVKSEQALPVPGEQDRGRLAVIRGEQEDRLLIAKRQGNQYVWMPIQESEGSEIAANPVAGIHWRAVSENLVTNSDLQQMTRSDRVALSPNRFRGWVFRSNLGAEEKDSFAGIRVGKGTDGKNVWGVGGENTPRFNWVLHQPLKLTPGSTYRARARVARNHAKNGLSLILDDGGNVGKSVSVTAVNQWEDLEVIFTIPENPHSTPRVRMHSSNCGEGREILVDYVVVEEVQPKEKANQ